VRHPPAHHPQALQCLLFVAVSYFFAGFQRDAGKFFLFFVVLLMFQVGTLDGVNLAVKCSVNSGCPCTTPCPVLLCPCIHGCSPTSSQ
jgi:hypothetical protein